MDMKLELVPVPVTDVDRAKAFYEKVGFVAGVDVRPSPGMRVVQLTPPGSSCSIVFGTGLGEISETAPGTLRGLHLVVDDIEKAVDGLAERGVSFEKYEGFDHDERGIAHPAPGPRIAWFKDPAGNVLSVIEM